MSEARYRENEIFVHNSLTGKKEKFEALKPPHIGMYVCGPTVYSDVHLGNCRTFISFDIVYRYLLHLGYKVRYVRNITDAGHLENDEDEGEDKIAKKARIEKIEPMEVVQKYTVGFHNIMRLFNAHPPSIEPTATGHIVEQIEMIKSILDAGMAYEVNGSVYFDVERYNRDGSYGKLSGRKIEELISGTRELDGQSEKRNPLDFALWKKASPSHIMRWPSPWSTGFPGWHLECSVMSSKYLGEEFDIHGGGMDLKFPHHECEIAQCKAANGKEAVHYWMHGNMLTLNGKRMSKTTGNTILPMELFTGDTPILEKGFHPSVVRFFMMQAHYGSTLDFSNEALLAAEKAFFRLMEAVQKLDYLESGKKEASVDVEAWSRKCYEAMNDDFNSPVLIGHLFEAVKWINSADQDDLQFSKDQLGLLHDKMHAFVFDILGLEQVRESGDEKLHKLIEFVIDLRNRARADRNFELSDRIRDELEEVGIILKDGKEETTYNIKS